MSLTMERECPTCHGAGKIPWTGIYADTLEFLRSQTEELNGAQLARLAGIKPTAMCNRLVTLQRMGFALGRRYGKECLWRGV